MPMTVVITRNVSDRFRGFLASCMLELAPGVYTSPRMTRAVRERVWKVCEEWFFDNQEEGSIVFTWRDAKRSGGQGVEILGDAPKDIVDHEGVLLIRRRVEDS